MTSRSYTLGLVFTLLGLMVMAVGHYQGLFVAPPEAMMGDVGRIFYVHVSTAINAMVFYLFAFVAAVVSLWGGRRAWDATTTALVEVGFVLNALLLVQGSLWARPTWGVYWTWDPRLTTSAVMAAAYFVVLLLRRLIDQPARRSMATAVATIIAFVDVPIVYFSVKWWNSLHQPMSSGKTIDSPMLVPLAISFAGTFLLGVGITVLRWRTETAHLASEAQAPDLPEVPTPLDFDIQHDRA